MNQEATNAGASKLASRHRKPRRLAQKIEGYLGGVMAIAALLLLIVLAYGVVHTGSGSPSWMR